MKKIIYILILCLAPAGPALAEIQCNQFEIILYSRVWRVTSYFVQDDIVLNPNKDFEILEPEGIAYKSGFVYASGDREQWSSGSRLAIYTWQSNVLAYSGYLQMPNTSPNWWGPDGLTFNLSGDASSYGSGPNNLVSVEVDTPSQAGIIDITTGSVTGKKPITLADDITHIASTGQFAAIADDNEISTVTIYDKMLDIAERNFPVIDGSRGIASVSSNFGEWMSGKTVSGGGFIITSAQDGVNTLVMYDLAGNQVGPQNRLPAAPKARIPLGGGLYMVYPAFGSIEAVAVDEANKTLFIGDESNAMLHVLTFVRLAADFDGDGDVDSTDLEIFAGQWLLADCVSPGWCSGTDLDRNGIVDLYDYALFAEYWQISEIY